MILEELLSHEESSTDHISGSFSINLKQLSNTYKSISPNKNKEIILLGTLVTIIANIYEANN